MKIFISWSGEHSKTIALELRQWLPDVIHSLEPWMSAADIKAGARWSADVASNLEDTRFGIICLTPENLAAPWILFEAGALAKTVAETFVCPYLIHMSPSDIPTGPLSQFQAKRANPEGTWELLQSLNHAMQGEGLSEDRLRRSFERCWPDLQKKLETLPGVANEKIPERPKEEILGETLDGVRELLRRSPSANTTPKYIYSITLGGRDSDIKEFARRVRQFDGYVSKTVGRPDADRAIEIEFAFDRRIDKDDINNAAEAEDLNILVKTMMRML